MQLLKITTTPIRFELSVERARLDIAQDNVKADISKTGGELRMEQKPAQMRMDSFEYRSSVGLKSIFTYMDEAAQRGKEAAMEATGDYASFGNEIIHIERGANIPDTAFSQYFRKATKGSLMLVPTSPIEISWQAGGAQIDYLPVHMNFDWSLGKAKLEYVPGKVSVNITQMPSIKFEYLGGWNYVPPSADPNFEAIA